MNNYKQIYNAVSHRYKIDGVTLCDLVCFIHNKNSYNTVTVKNLLVGVGIDGNLISFNKYDSTHYIYLCVFIPEPSRGNKITIMLEETDTISGNETKIGFRELISDIQSYSDDSENKT